MGLKRRMTYIELLRASDKARPGKEARLIHRELKKYGDGLLLWDRHPALAKLLVILLNVSISVAAVQVIIRLAGIN